MRSYRYLKNAERWVTIIGLFFFGVTFVSQSLAMTKISIVTCGLMFFVRVFLKYKMRSLFRRSQASKAKDFDENDYSYVFTWAVVCWTLFMLAMMVAGFLFSIDLIGIEGLRRTVWGLGIFIGTYCQISSMLCHSIS